MNKKKSKLKTSYETYLDSSKEEYAGATVGGIIGALAITGASMYLGATVGGDVAIEVVQWLQSVAPSQIVDHEVTSRLAQVFNAEVVDNILRVASTVGTLYVADKTVGSAFINTGASIGGGVGKGIKSVKEKIITKNSSR